jgi:hypothetical protein
MASRLLAICGMRAQGNIGKRGSHATAIVFPATLLVLTPIFDIMRAITDNMAWTRRAFACAFVGVNLALVVFMPLLLDWLALDRGTVARRLCFPSLLLQALGIFVFVMSVIVRLHRHGSVSLPAFALADAGVALLAVAALIAAPQATRPPHSLPPRPAPRGM